MRTSNLLLYGFVALVLAWLIIPIIIIVPMSFSSARFLTFPPPSWSLRWYEAYLGIGDLGEIKRLDHTLLAAANAVLR
ncbi:ABC transporter permease, partial [Rhizobium johnstonii]